MNKEKQHIPAGYKPSPLGPIPEDWEVKRLGEVCTFHDSQRVPIKDADRVKMKGEYPYYGASGIIDYVNDYLFDDDLILLGEDGANIINRSTPLAFLVSGKVWVNNHAHVLKTKDKYNRYFVCLYLESLTYDKYNTGTAQPKLNREICESIPVLIPKTDEQNKIATILQLWDTAIEKQTALIEKLTLRKRGLMQQLLTGKKRLKGFSGGWKEVRLGKIGTFFKGSGVPKDSITSEGHKCLTYGDLYTKYDYVISNVKSYIDDNTANNSAKIQYGDICFAGSGETKEDIGKCAAFIDGQCAYAGGDIIVFRAEGFNPITLSYILNSDSVIRQKSNLGQGHSVVHIYPYQLERITISSPSIEEQTAIASVLINADKEIELANKKLARLQEEKRGLMQVLLTGKKRIHNLQ